MANLDYKLIVQELQPIVGKFYDKFYELETGKFRLKFGRDNILIELPLRIHKTKYIEEAPAATPFAMKIRKELKGKLLTKLSQHKKDRVIIFDFDGTKVIAEMFGKGNLVLVREGKILAVYSRERWKGRELKPRADYAFPPSETKTLEELMDSKSENAIAAELRSLDIGMSYVRALLEDAKVEHSKPLSELTKEEKAAIESSFRTLKSAPHKFSAFTKGKKFPSLSEALDEYYGIPEPIDEEEEEKETELEKLTRLLETQEQRLKELKEEEQDARKKADYIYAHYEEIGEILSLYKKGGLEAVEKLAKEKGWTLNKKEKEIEI